LASAIFILISVLPAFAVYQEFNSSRMSKSDFGDLEVMITRYEPYPVQPGKYFDFWVKVENRGTHDINSAEFKLIPEYPFSLYGGEVSVKDIGKLGPFEAAVLKYRVRVDSNAVLGNNPLRYAYHENRNNPWNDASVDVFVQPRDLNLAIEKISLEPEKIGPGEKGKISFSIKNYADSTAENIKVKLDLSGSSVPIAPLNSVGEKTISLLNSRKETVVEFDVIALSDAEAKIYKIPVEVKYYDNLGKSYNISNVFALPVSKEPDVYFISDGTTLSGEGTTGTVTIKIVNSGATGIKFLDMKVLPSEDYELLSSDRSYIGKIDSDDYETAEFSLHLKNSPNLEFNIPIAVSYQDSTNYNYEKKDTIKVSMAKTKYEKKNGNGSSSWLIIAIIVVVLGFILYRRWAKKKEN
jgi:hypothetical protein